MDLADWFLTADERGNPATEIDSRHPDGLAWTSGNLVRPLIHGSTYFTELKRSLATAGAGDLVLFTDWRGDPDEWLDDEGTEVSTAFCEASQRDAVVRGLIWRSHWDKLSFSEEANRHLGEKIEAAGGKCLLDLRVRPLGSHHQKFVVIRHVRDASDDVAFVGGIDLCHSRRDDARHQGDRQRQSMAKVYGERPPWHDVQAAITGPSVADVEYVFRERWSDPAPMTRNPMHRTADVLRRDDRTPDRLPDQAPPPPPVGTSHVQLLRTYPYRRRGYPFAPDGERSIARGYSKVVSRAQRLIYVEDQYLWSAEITERFAAALRENPELLFVAVIPMYPDQDGPVALPPNLTGRQESFDLLCRAAPDRVAIFGIENHVGTPVYVHAKVCVIDDVWASIGSDNVNRRSWTHDSELTCAVLDDELDDRAPAVIDRFGHGARRYARALRLQLAREHLDRDDGDDADLVDPASFFAAFAETARRLDDWHAGGRRGTRPAGRLRACPSPAVSRLADTWARPLYAAVFDPDGRPRALRRAGRF
jgi:phosphatidylserine/phosphatidylglycerophosphate/cardiolipin synthase-like enzyme